MNIVRNVVVGIAALFLLAMVVGTLMPSKFTVERSDVIAAAAPAVFAKFATPRTWAAWSAWNASADTTLRYTYEGPDSGAGAVMKWTAKRMGTGSLRIVEAVEHSSVRYEVRMTGTELVVNGHVTFAPEGAGTRVTWRDRGDVGTNPLMRLALPMLDGAMGNAFETGFRGLRRALVGERT